MTNYPNDEAGALLGHFEKCLGDDFVRNFLASHPAKHLRRL